LDFCFFLIRASSFVEFIQCTIYFVSHVCRRNVRWPRSQVTSSAFPASSGSTRVSLCPRRTISRWSCGILSRTRARRVSYDFVAYYFINYFYSWILLFLFFLALIKFLFFF
jgi:hypothetical protein